MELIVRPSCLPRQLLLPVLIFLNRPFPVLRPLDILSSFFRLRLRPEHLSKLFLPLEPSRVACRQFSLCRLFDERLAVRSCGFSLLDRDVSHSCGQGKEGNRPSWLAALLASPFWPASPTSLLSILKILPGSRRHFLPQRHHCHRHLVLTAVIEVPQLNLLHRLHTPHWSVSKRVRHHHKYQLLRLTARATVSLSW